MSDTTDQLPTEIAPTGRLLTAAEFHRLADVPPEVEWFANLSNPHTRRVYENAVKDFMRFTGIMRPEEFRIVTRAHVIAWRDDLVRRGLGGSTIRNRLASIASLFEYLCEKNAVTHNPVKASSGRSRKAAKARRQPLAITRRASCSARQPTTAFVAGATAPFSRRCCSTLCAARNCASSR